MVLFKKKVKPGEHEVLKEGAEEVIHINYENYQRVPSIEDDPLVMSSVIEKLSQSPGVSRIVFHQRKKYEYGFNQTQMLLEVAQIYNHFIKQKNILTQAALEIFGPLPDASSKIKNLQYVILNLLKTDPIGAFVETKRLLREEKITLSKIQDENYKTILQPYIVTLGEIYSMLSSASIIISVKDQLAGYQVGTRDLYKQIFRPSITPDFMYTRLAATPPVDADAVDSYQIAKNAYVQVYSTKDTIKPLYHLIPPEFQISEDKYELVELARKVLAEHQPKAEEFLDTEKMRTTFLNIGKDLITELAQHRRISLSYEETEELAEILVRYTVGFGMIEILLKDPNIQDIAINSPSGTPIFIVHAKYDECITNIASSAEDVEGWASKFRLISARPLDEANPVLDTELTLPDARARVAIITRPLNPTGIAFSIRRHRDKPWTLPLFIKNGMINDMAAGLISFLIDGARTLMISGTKSSGKTALAGSFLVEIMRKYRILIVEDTREISTETFNKLGYDIQPMKVRSALLKTGTEMSAEEGIRTALRMGDSALVIGEVRSTEAIAMFEAMRIGALANSVIGTIHGGSPYSVFDRVVNDLGVPRTSFKATDIIIIANPVKSADGLHRFRRVTQITEVRKEWEQDPLTEGAFVDLMRYDTKLDELVPTDELINGDSDVIKSIASQIKEFAGNWPAIWENILLRAKIKRTIVEYSERYNLPDLLEAKDIIQMNDEFHRVTDRVREETGKLDTERIFFEWEESLKKHIKKNYKIQL